MQQLNNKQVLFWPVMKLHQVNQSQNAIGQQMHRISNIWQYENTFALFLHSKINSVHNLAVSKVGAGRFIDWHQPHAFEDPILILLSANYRTPESIYLTPILWTGLRHLLLIFRYWFHPFQPDFHWYSQLNTRLNN